MSGDQARTDDEVRAVIAAEVTRQVELQSAGMLLHLAQMGAAIKNHLSGMRNADAMADVLTRTNGLLEQLAAMQRTLVMRVQALEAGRASESDGVIRH